MQITEAVGSMNQLTVKVSEATDDIARSARDLQARAHRMQAAVSAFKGVPQAERSTTASPSLPPAPMHVRMP